MGRIIAADERITKQIEGFFSGDKWQVGLVIGTLCAQRSQAVHLSRTPKQEDDNEPTENNEKQGAKSAKNKTKSPESNLDSVDERWVANHAKQVMRMLPGGLDVIGVYAVATPDGLKTAQAKLRQLVFAVHKALTKLSTAEPGANKTNDRVLLQICSVTRKLTCRTFDVTDHKCSASPADWKPQTVIDRLVSLSSQMVLDETIVIPEQGLSQTLHKQILAGLNPIINNISTAKCMINGSIMDDTEVLCKEEKPSGKKKMNKADREPAPNQKFTVDILAQNSATFAESVSTECGAKMLLRGTIKSLAYVSQKSTVEEATASIKSDIIRSLISRCILLCEDVEATEEDQDVKILYETPRRITGRIPSSQMEVCDYMFPEETVTDAVSRFVELLDIPVTDSDINLDFETLPDDEELEKPGDIGAEDREMKTTAVSISSSTNTNILYTIGGIIAVLVAILVYLLLNEV